MKAGPLLRQMREQGVDAWFISGDGIVSDDFVKATGSPEFLTKTLMTFGADPRNPATNPAGASLVSKFRSGGYEPEGYTLYAYTAVPSCCCCSLQPTTTPIPVKLLPLGLREAELLLSWAIKSFDRKGDLQVSDYVMYQWNTDGSYNEL